MDVPSARDQLIGVGDGESLLFPLVKNYGAGEAVQERRIYLPVAGSVRISVDGVETQNFTLDADGAVTLDVAPDAGAAICAGYLFDVPVRFASDRLEVSRATYLAGEISSVPLIEVRGALL